MKTFRLIPVTFFALFLLFSGASAIAGNSTSGVAKASKILATDESLSGISLLPVKQTGTFQLQFSKEIQENGTLELKNAGGQTLFSQELNAAENYANQKMDVGKLSAGIYLIEMKTGNTVYWKKVRIRK